MRLLSLILVTACVLPARAQDEIDPKPQIAKDKYEKAIRRIAGVKDISVGGVNGKRQIILMVESDDVKKDVTTLTGGSLDGVPIAFVVSATQKTTPVSGPCAGCVCPCHKRVGTTVAEPAKKKEEPKPEDECDFILEALGKKRTSKEKDRCQQMVGWTNDANKKEWVKKEGLPHWDSQEMGSYFLCYTYIKHRVSCPLNKRKLDEVVDKLTPGK